MSIETKAVMVCNGMREVEGDVSMECRQVIQEGEEHVVLVIKAHRSSAFKDLRGMDRYRALSDADLMKTYHLHPTCKAPHNLLTGAVQRANEAHL